MMKGPTRTLQLLKIYFPFITFLFISFYIFESKSKMTGNEIKRVQKNLAIVAHQNNTVPVIKDKLTEQFEFVLRHYDDRHKKSFYRKFHRPYIMLNDTIELEFEYISVVSTDTSLHLSEKELLPSKRWTSGIFSIKFDFGYEIDSSNFKIFDSYEVKELGSQIHNNFKSKRFFLDSNVFFNHQPIILISCSLFVAWFLADGTSNFERIYQPYKIFNREIKLEIPIISNEDYYNFIDTYNSLINNQKKYDSLFCIFISINLIFSVILYFILRNMFFKVTDIARLKKIINLLFIIVLAFLSMLSTFIYYSVPLSEVKPLSELFWALLILILLIFLSIFLDRNPYSKFLPSGSDGALKF